MPFYEKKESIPEELESILSSMTNPTTEQVSQAAATMQERVNTAAEFVSQIIDTSKLTSEQLKIVASYSLFDTRKNYTAQEIEKEARHLQLMVDFLQDPESFKPSRAVYASIYARYISEKLGERVWTGQVTDAQIEWAMQNDLIRSVGVNVEYKLPDSQSLGGCIMNITAEINYGKLQKLLEDGSIVDKVFNRQIQETISTVKGQSWQEIKDEAAENIKNSPDEWRTIQEGAIGFSLPQWIERI